MAAKIGKVKTENRATSVFSPAREEEVITNVLAAEQGAARRGHHPGHLSARSSAGRGRCRRSHKVAFLGPEYSVTATSRPCERFGRGGRVHAASATSRRCSRRSTAGTSTYGVVPLENSTDGRVADTLDMFIRMPQIKICCRGSAARPPQPAGQLRADGDPPGLQQAAGPVAVPQLAAQERAAGDAARSVEHGDGGPARADASRARPRSPAGRRRCSTGCASCSRTSRTRRTTRRGSPSSATHDSGADRQRQDGPHVPDPAQPGLAGRRLDIFKQNKVNLTWIESFPYRDGQAGVRLLRRFRGPRGRPEGEEGARRARRSTARS